MTPIGSPFFLYTQLCHHPQPIDHSGSVGMKIRTWHRGREVDDDRPREMEREKQRERERNESRRI
jgi:hypothetical protein